MAHQNYDIIIVGAGTVGSIFALKLALLRPDLTIALIDSKIDDDFDFSAIDNRIFAISANNYKVLLELNVWPEKRFGSIDKMNVRGDVDSNLFLETEGDYLAKTVENSYLLYLICQKLKTLNNVSLIIDKIETIDNNPGNPIELISEKNKYIGYLLVGADGVNSFVRNKVSFKINSYNYNRFGIVANFLCEKNHNNIAHQWFKNDKILAYLPYLDDNIISIVLSIDNPDCLFKMKTNELEDYIASLGNYELGKMQLISSINSYPLKLNIVNNIYKKNIVLIGDAAHTIHPLAGLGINIGFNDAFELANILSRLVDKEQFGSIAVLNKYSLSRITSVIKMQLFCHFLFNFFAIENDVLRNVRNLGFKIINKSIYLKKLIVSQVNKLV